MVLYPYLGGSGLSLHEWMPLAQNKLTPKDE